MPRWGAVLLAAFLMASSARSQEAMQPGLEDAEVLDKLYQIREETFLRIANRLVSFAGASRQGQDYHARFVLFEPQLAYIPRGPNGEWLGGQEKWTFKRRGRAQVFGNGRMWSPRSGDLNENFKDLYVTGTAGKPRSIRFHFRVHATESKGKGANEVITVFGREELQFELIEHPRDRTLRLVLDPGSFLKHQKSLTSNVVPEENQAAEDGKESGEKGAQPGLKAVPQPAPGTEVTLVRSFKATEHGITIRFRRKWSGLDGQVADGTLQIQMDSSLSTGLYYDVPKTSGKKMVKMVRLEAASFHGGYRSQP